MNNYLIFRTDRIGDFLLSMILIKNIKRNDRKSYIVVVCSEKNYDYIKTFSFVDKVIKFKNEFINRFKLIKELRQYTFKFTIVHDGKKRSNLINFFLNKDETLVVNNNNIKNSHFFKIKKIIDLMNFKFDITDLDILVNRSSDIKNLNKMSSIILHYDEKWSNSTYISKYEDIEPSETQLLNFINNIKLKLNHQIIITTGVNTPVILKNVISKINDDKIKLIEGLKFEKLEEIVSQSKLLISCHGAISHVASAYNIKQIDIIDINKQSPYSIWTDHFRNYSPVYRIKFDELSNKIIDLM